MKNKPFALTVLALNCALVTAAWAQDQGLTAPAVSGSILPSGAVQNPALPVSSNTGLLSGGVSSTGAYAPKALRLGGFSVTPTLGTAVGRNTNVALQAGSAEIASNFVNLVPQVTADAAYRADRYRLAYVGDITRYASYSRANTSNHEVSAQGLNVFTGRSSLNWRVGYQDREDPLGSTNSSPVVGAATTPDHYTAVSASALYGYGAQTAQGRFEVGADLNDKEYKATRAGVDQLDVASRNLVGRFYYRVSPRTQLIAEYRNTAFDYDVAPLDNTEQRVLAGATWEATAATTGTVKAGYMRKKFDDRANSDFSGATWEGNLRWAPLTYSSFSFTTGRAATDPSGGTATYLLTSTHSAAWIHNWASYLQSNVNYSRSKSQFVGEVPSRDDEIDTVTLSLNYQFRRWLRAGVEYQYSDRESTAAGFNYKRNLLVGRAEVGF